MENIYLFLIIAGLYLVDLGSDWFLVRQTFDKYDSFRDFQRAKIDPVLDTLVCNCTLNANDRCDTLLSPNTSVCRAIADYNANTDDSYRCNPYMYLHREGESFVFDLDKYKSELSALKDLRWAALFFAALVTPGVFAYLVWLTRRKSLTDVDSASISNEQENAHELDTMSQKLCWSCSKPVSHTAMFCPDCGAKLREPGQAGDTRARRKLRHWLGRLVKLLQIRVAFLALEDIPLVIVLIVLIVVLDAPDGLDCGRCIADIDDPTCRFGQDVVGATVVVGILGTLCSMVVLFMQTAIAKQRLAQQNMQSLRVQLCGFDAFFFLAAVVGSLASPVLFMIAASDMRNIMMLSSTQVTVIYVFAAITAVPPLLFIFSLLAIMCDQMGTDMAFCGGECECECCECC